MGYAKYIGRVGALAVALGVGAAVATGLGTGVAWADDTGSSSTDSPSTDSPSTDSSATGSTGTSPSAGATGSASSPGPPQVRKLRPVPAGPNRMPPSSAGSTASGTETSGSPTSNSPTGSAPTDTAAGDNATTTPGDTDAQPGVQAGEPQPDAIAAPAADPPAQESVATNPPPPIGTQSPAPQDPATAVGADRSADGSAVVTQVQAADTTAAPATADAQTPTPRSADQVLRQRAAVTISTASQTGGVQAAETAQMAISAYSARSTATPASSQAVQPAAMAAPVTSATIASGLLAAVGLTSLAPGPAAPVESPAVLAMLAVAARRQPPAEQAPTLDPMQTSQDLDGTVHGTFGGADRNSDPLTYRVPATGIGAPTDGTVTIDQAAGTWTYTPSDDWDGTSQIDDQFTVTVSDIGDPGFHLKGAAAINHTDTATVTVTVAPSSQGPTIVGAIPLNGAPSGGLVFAEHGTRAYQTTYSYDPNIGLITSAVTVINTVDGTAVADPVTLSGTAIGGLVLSEDGSRAFQTTYVYDPGTGSYTTVVTAIDASDGTVIGDPITLNGTASGGLVLSEDGTHAYQTTSYYDPSIFGYSTDVTAIDPSDGTVVGDPITLNGSPSGGLVFSQDGTRAYQTTYVYDPGTDYSTVVAVIDTTDGTVVVGDPINGSPSGGGLVFSQDGTRAAIATRPYDPGTGSYSTVVAVIDPTDGTVVGDPIPLNGFPISGLVFSQDGTRAAIATSVYDPGTGSFSTVVAVIDSTDGTVVGDPLTLHGSPAGLVLSADGTRAFQTTSVFGTGASSTVVTVIDPADGTVIGDPLTLNGTASGGVVLSRDGTRAFQSTSVQDPGTGSFSTVVTVIDPTDGSIIGDPLTLNGAPSGGPVFSQDGTRAYQTTYVYDPGTGSYTTAVTAIDPTDGRIIGASLTFNGAPAGLVFSEDGTRAYQTTYFYDSATQSYTTVVTVIDTGVTPGPLV